MSRNPPRRRLKPSKRNLFAGPSTCLRCDEAFESWDCRQNRLCPRCRQAIEEQPSEEPRYSLLRPKHRSGQTDDA
jgi:hypothetical protein